MSIVSWIGTSATQDNRVGVGSVASWLQVWSHDTPPYSPSHPDWMRLMEPRGDTGIGDVYLRPIESLILGPRD